MFATMPAQEIKRRGMSALNADLKSGPVYVISGNRPKYVVLFADDFRRMVHEAFVEKCHQAEADILAGRCQRGSVDDLMADIMAADEEE